MCTQGTPLTLLMNVKIFVNMSIKCYLVLQFLSDRNRLFYVASANHSVSQEGSIERASKILSYWSSHIFTSRVWLNLSSFWDTRRKICFKNREVYTFKKTFKWEISLSQITQPPHCSFAPANSFHSLLQQWKHYGLEISKTFSCFFYLRMTICQYCFVLKMTICREVEEITW